MIFFIFLFFGDQFTLLTINSIIFRNNFFYRTPPVPTSENNEQQQLPDACYKIVSTILLQKLINGFAVCKHCSGTFSLVEDVISSHGFGN